jgi:hypothetical protein
MDYFGVTAKRSVHRLALGVADIGLFLQGEQTSGFIQDFFSALCQSKGTL